MHFRRQYLLFCYSRKKLHGYASQLTLFSKISFRDTILEIGLDEVLLNIHNTSDNTAWDLIDQALTILRDIAPYSKKSNGSVIQSDDGSGPSTSQQSEKEKSGLGKKK